MVVFVSAAQREDDAISVVAKHNAGTFFIIFSILSAIRNRDFISYRQVQEKNVGDVKLIQCVKIMSVQFDRSSVCSVFAASSNPEDRFVNQTFDER